MFHRLKQKWNVNGTQLILILCVFAITGTTTAWLTRSVTQWLQLDASSFWYWAIKIGILLFGYQILILLFAIPFGQFNFFWNYEKKILQRMKLISNPSLPGKKQNLNKINVDHYMLSAGIEETGTNQSAIGNRQSAMSDQPAEENQKAQHSATQPKTKNQKPETINVAIFASGAGSNAQKIIDHFRQHTEIKIALIVCNKPGAGVLTIAQKENIPTLIIEKEPFFRGNAYVDELKQHNVDFIVLAGFLWKVPVALVQAFPLSIINIHPALLPNYGGKGMYGRFVHEAVITAKEKESGISIHYVDELYDHGKLIFQARCTIDETDTADSLAQKIHALEHEHYPVIVEKVARELQKRR
ncbi:phosphoribosylglycinamide formyltransferase [Niastella sp. OAS944]|uniref:phosphoribosylglycinamide formyltransferase n=1 Tax=Niastella sp. OAS944 TaxID=2664089 RepID=UPI0034981260|nr:formyltetrahydrofolate-dependent phosphoribosylglycinamide formyltransferase [Chitinophagaceae bacterium OAS944]